MSALPKSRLNMAFAIAVTKPLLSATVRFKMIGIKQSISPFLTSLFGIFSTYSLSKGSYEAMVR